MSLILNDTLAVERPAPRHFSFTEPYWEATRRQKLAVQYCRQSEKYQFYPRPVSIFTGGRDLEWREVSGRGELFTWTIAQIGRAPFGGATPYVVATVTLEEGVNVIANLINCSTDQLFVGLRVQAAWAPLPDGTNLLMFEPDAAAWSIGEAK